MTEMRNRKILAEKSLRRRAVSMKASSIIMNRNRTHSTAIFAIREAYKMLGEIRKIYELKNRPVPTFAKGTAIVGEREGVIGPGESKT